MKKKIFTAVLILSLSVSMIGCGKKGSDKDSLKNDIIEFVNDELPSISEDRDNAIDIYNSYFTTEDVDMDNFLVNLKESALPKMQTYITNLTAIEVSTDEVSGLKDLYLQSSQKQYEAMTLVVSAIEGENPEYLTLADSLIDESKSLLTQYESQLKILAVDNNITINGTFTSSSNAEQNTDAATDQDTGTEAE